MAKAVEASISAPKKKRRREIQLNVNFQASEASESPSRTVFFVHDGFGETLIYRELANALPTNVAVYGLYPMSHDGVAMAQTRMEDIAAAYVERIRAVQPHGPYFLGGLCGGGVIAFEAARQLELENEKIGMLALLDSRDIAAKKKLGYYTLARMREFSEDFGEQGHLSRPLPFLRTTWKYLANIHHLLYWNVAAKVGKLGAHLKVWLLRKYLNGHRSAPEFLRRLSVEQIYFFAEWGYKPKTKLHGDAVLFRAASGNGTSNDEPFRNLFNDPLLGWGARVEGQVHAVDVSGGHYTMLESPNAQVIAREIRERLGAS